jgi:hypothetical protein
MLLVGGVGCFFSARERIEAGPREEAGFFAV